MLEIFATLIAATGLGLAAVYNARYRNHPWDKYYPRLAWLRAGIYFCVCWTLAYFSGALDLILTRPVVTAEQLADTSWRIYTAGALVFIVGAYSILWCYFTPVFERKRYLLVQAVFGMLWGSSSGLLFVSVWLIVSLPDWPTWVAGVATFLILAAYQPNWHSIYWDHYIAPEHDTPMTQVIKATCCHIPNLLIMLPYLILYENYLLFVLAQVIACTSASIGLRFPPWWDAPSEQNYAPRSNARIPRCTGYIPDDPKTDPYTPFYPGWRGAG